MQKSQKFLINLSIAVSLGLVCFASTSFGAAIALPTQVQTIMDTAKSWIRIIAGTLAIIFFVWGGITFMTANGDPEKVKTARQMILWAFVGALVVALSEVLYNIAVSIGTSLQ